MKALLIITLLFSFNANSKILHKEFSYKNKTYYFNYEFLVKAPINYVLKTLTDYENLPKIQSSIISSQILEKHKTQLKVKITNQDCILFFCKKIINTQIVTFPNHNTIISKTIPSESNLNHGLISWNLTPTKNNKTIVKIKAEFNFNFFIPPLIGKAIIKNKTTKSLDEVITNIEKLYDSKTNPITYSSINSPSRLKYPLKNPSISKPIFL
jgi:uncharacterized membrane protein